MFKVDNKNTRRRSGVFIVHFEHISHLFLVFVEYWVFQGYKMGKLTKNGLKEH